MDSIANLLGYSVLILLGISALAGLWVLTLYVIWGAKHKQIEYMKVVEAINFHRAYHGRLKGGRLLCPACLKEEDEL